jgi:DNA-binding protein YbaB
MTSLLIKRSPILVVYKDNSLLQDIIAGSFSEALQAVDQHYKRRPFDQIPSRLEVQVIRDGFNLCVSVECYA